MTTNQMVQWATLIAMLLAAGMWLGSLQNRVSQLEREHAYYHGSPKVK